MFLFIFLLKRATTEYLFFRDQSPAGFCNLLVNIKLSLPPLSLLFASGAFLHSLMGVLVKASMAVIYYLTLSKSKPTPLFRTFCSPLVAGLFSADDCTLKLLKARFS